MAPRPLMKILATLLAGMLFAAAGVAAQQPKREKKVWTNEDLEALRGQVPITTGAGAGPTVSSRDAEEREARGKKEGAKREKEDPAKEFQKRMEPLRKQLEQIDNEIRQVRSQQSNPGTGDGRIVLGKTHGGVSPEGRILQLEQRKKEVLQKISELEDDARRAGIPPGALR